jgi:hypothetical protein
VQPCTAFHVRDQQGDGARRLNELRRPEVRARAGFVLTVVYRVAGSMRSLARVTAAGVRCPQGPHAGPLCQDRRSYSVTRLQQ